MSATERNLVTLDMSYLSKKFRLAIVLPPGRGCRSMRFANLA